MTTILTEKQFFDWMREQTKEKRLTQAMVNGGKEMIASMGIKDVMSSLSKINSWTNKIDDGNPTEMKFSENGTAMLAAFEKFVSAPYLDMAGVWTIGYGNTYYPNGKRVTKNDKALTKAEATKLKMDIVNRDFAAAVNIMFASEIEKGRITQNMFDALVMLSYNIGVNGLQGSSVARLIKANRKSAAADAFLLWNKAKVNGVRRVVRGLTIRREKERELFLTV